MPSARFGMPSDATEFESVARGGDAAFTPGFTVHLAPKPTGAADESIANLRQHYLASLSPMLITELGTHWTDVLLLQRTVGGARRGVNQGGARAAAATGRASAILFPTADPSAEVALRSAEVADLYAEIARPPSERLQLPYRSLAHVACEADGGRCLGCLFFRGMCVREASATVFDREAALCAMPGSADVPPHGMGASPICNELRRHAEAHGELAAGLVHGDEPRHDLMRGGARRLGQGPVKTHPMQRDADAAAVRDYLAHVVSGAEWGAVAAGRAARGEGTSTRILEPTVEQVRCTLRSFRSQFGEDRALVCCKISTPSSPLSCP